jgi:hypothetical protein
MEPRWFAENKFVVGTLEGDFERSGFGLLGTLEAFTHQDVMLFFGEIDRANARIHVDGLIELEGPVRSDATEWCFRGGLVFLGLDDLVQGLFSLREGLDVIREEDLLVEPALLECVVTMVILEKGQSAPMEEVRCGLGCFDIFRVVMEDVEGLADPAVDLSEETALGSDLVHVGEGGVDDMGIEATLVRGEDIDRHTDVGEL